MNKKGIHWSTLFAIIMGLVVLIVVTIIMRDKIFMLFDSFMKTLGGLK